MSSAKSQHRVTVTKNGPYLVKGAIPLAPQIIAADTEGGSDHWSLGVQYPVQEQYALCRCGRSKNAPFCDGTHALVGFDGTETADRRDYAEQAVTFDGPGLNLLDVQALCAAARFCDTHGKVWKEVVTSDDPDIRKTFLRQVGDCPSGRLVAFDTATGKVVEPNLPVSIGLIEDPQENCEGPLWLRGGISVIAADGFAYEVRNRVTLCRCGASGIKPFCDGSHISVKFQGRSPI